MDQPNLPRLTLYHRPGCSYCAQVQKAAERLGIGLDLCDITRDASGSAALQAAMGRTRVPVLRIDFGGGEGSAAVRDWAGEGGAAHDFGADDVAGDDVAGADDVRWMPESMTIIRYLKGLMGRSDPVPVWLDQVLARAWTPALIAFLAGIVGLGGPLSGFLVVGGGALAGLYLVRRVASVYV